MNTAKSRRTPSFTTGQPAGKARMADDPRGGKGDHMRNCSGRHERLFDSAVPRRTAEATTHRHARGGERWRSASIRVTNTRHAGLRLPCAMKANVDEHCTNGTAPRRRRRCRQNGVLRADDHVGRQPGVQMMSPPRPASSGAGYPARQRRIPHGADGDRRGGGALTRSTCG